MKLIDVINKIDIRFEWLNRYQKFVPQFIEEAKSGKDWSEWGQEVFFEFFCKGGMQCVASLQQGNFSKKEQAEIKENWSELAPLLQKLAKEQDTPNWECYEEINACLRKYTTNNKKAATSRLIASLQPKLLTTIATESDLKDLYRILLKEYKIEDLSEPTGDYFRDSYTFMSLLRASLPDRDYMDIVTYPWQILEAFYNSQNKTTMMSEELAKLKSVIEHKKQIVLQGAPGTGKTYKTAELAVALCDGACDYPDRETLMKRYQELCKEHRIMFTTFHQSMDYESFIEGIKPSTEDGVISYDVEDGIFKQICNRASVKSSTNTFDEAYQKLVDDIQNTPKGLLPLSTKKGAVFAVSLNRKGNLNLHTGDELNKQGVLTKDNLLQATYRDDVFIGWEGYALAVIKYLVDRCKFVKDMSGEPQKYVLIIDEINRGNISKIFGELITLLEADKRIGAENKIKLRLPYSGELFGVPSNLYIIATMNTADRSVGYIDYAIRRRFSFITLKSERSVLENLEKVKTKPVSDSLRSKILALFDDVAELMDNISIEFNKDDLMIGHSYFIAENEEELRLKLDYEIKPLLREYANDGILVLSKEDEKKIDDLSI